MKILKTNFLCERVFSGCSIWLYIFFCVYTSANSFVFFYGSIGKSVHIAFQETFFILFRKFLTSQIWYTHLCVPTFFSLQSFTPLWQEKKNSFLTKVQNRINIKKWEGNSTTSWLFKYKEGKSKLETVASCTAQLRHEFYRCLDIIVIS